MELPHRPTPRSLSLLTHLGVSMAAAGCLAGTISEINLHNASAPGSPLGLGDAAALEAELQSFADRPDNGASREAIADAVLAHYQAAGWPVVDVAVENPQRGVLLAAVTEGRWGEISVAGGSDWMRRAAFRDWSRLRGEPLTTGGLAAALAWLHRNPLHAGAVSFAPGAETATADAMLTLEETRPFRLSTGFRDDGAPPLSRGRFYAGVEVADAFGVPSWWHAEVSSATSRGEYSGVRSVLRLFLTSHHELRFGGFWSQSSSTMALLPGFDAVSDFEAWNVSARFVTPLPSRRGWNSEWSLGADFFRLNSHVTLAGFGTAGEADALHLTTGLHSEHRGETSRSGVDAELAWSPGGITSSADDASHSAMRSGASADYFLLRAGAWTERELSGGWTATLRASGQWSSEPVLPLQAFSPAGASGVRGFPAASTLGDSGVLGSAELLTPAYSLRGLQARAAAFADGAWMHDRAAHQEETAVSAGAGLRLQWRGNFGASLDYGWRLTEPGGRLHVALSFEF